MARTTKIESGPGDFLIRFSLVVERSNVEAVLSEQELTEPGIVRQGPAAAQRGQMTGTRDIGLGTVSSQASNGATKTSGGGMSLLGIGGRREQAETTDDVAIDIRVVEGTFRYDNSSSETRRTRSVLQLD